MSCAVRRRLRKLPQDTRNDAGAQLLMQIKDEPALTIVQLI